MTRRQYVATIAGLGSSATSTVTPLPLSEVANRADVSTGKSAPTSRFEDDYVPCLRDIAIGAQSCSPIGGDPLGGTLGFTVVLANSDVRAFLARRDAVQPVGRLLGTSALTWPESQLVIDRTDEPIVDDDILYIADMALRVDSITGNAVTLVDVMPDGSGGLTDDLSVDGLDGKEGHFGTFLRDIAARTVPPYPDGYVYLQRPRLRGLVVRLYHSDGEDLEELVWIGRIRSTKLVNGGTAVRVECEDAMADVRASKLGTRAPRWSAVPVVTGWREISVVLTDGSRATVEHVYSSGDAAWMQLGKSVRRTGAYTFTGPAGRLERLSGPRWGSEDQFGADPIACELIPTDGRAFATASQHPLYTSDTSIEGGAAGPCANPLDIVRAFLGTIDTGLPASWRVWRTPDMAAAYVDDDAIVTVRDRVTPGMRWPGMLVGKDGEAVDAMELLSGGILQPLGLSFAAGLDGRLTVVTLRDSGARGATSLTTATVMPGGMDEGVDDEAAYDTVRAASGKGWDGVDRVTLTVTSATQPVTDVQRARELVFNALGLISPESTDHADAPEVVGYLAWLEFAWRLFRFEPQIVSLVALPTVDVAIGAWVTLSTRQLMDRTTGGPPSDLTSVSGFVLRRQVDAESGAQSLDVLVVPYADDGRISGAATVTSRTHGASDTELTCAASTWIGSGGYSGGPSAITMDVQQFAATNVCVIVSRRGVDVSEPFVVNAVGTNTITGQDVASGTRIKTVGGGSDYAVTSGDVVMLADHGDASSGTKSVYAWLGVDDYQI